MKYNEWTSVLPNTDCVGYIIWHDGDFVFPAIFMASKRKIVYHDEKCIVECGFNDACGTDAIFFFHIPESRPVMWREPTIEDQGKGLRARVKETTAEPFRESKDFDGKRIIYIGREPQYSGGTRFEHVVKIGGFEGRYTRYGICEVCDEKG